MKTVNEIIRETGITRQTLYNAVKRAGTTVQALATEKRGNTMLFDEAAEKELSNIVTKNSQKNVNVKRELSKTETKLKQQEETVKRLQDEAEELRQKLEEYQRLAEDAKRLQSELEKLQEENRELNEERRVMLGTIATHSQTIDRMTREQEQKRLASGAEDQRPGWIRRTLQRITGKGRKE